MSEYQIIYQDAKETACCKWLLIVTKRLALLPDLVSITLFVPTRALVLTELIGSWTQSVCKNTK